MYYVRIYLQIREWLITLFLFIPRGFKIFFRYMKYESPKDFSYESPLLAFKAKKFGLQQKIYSVFIESSIVRGDPRTSECKKKNCYICNEINMKVISEFFWFHSQQSIILKIQLLRWTANEQTKHSNRTKLPNTKFEPVNWKY